MQLYLIVHNDCNGENFDLFVWAHSPEEARMKWVEYYDLPPEEEEALDKDGKIFEVPLDRPHEAGAIGWDQFIRHLN